MKPNLHTGTTGRHQRSNATTTQVDIDGNSVTMHGANAIQAQDEATAAAATTAITGAGAVGS